MHRLENQEYNEDGGERRAPEHEGTLAIPDEPAALPANV